LRCFVPFSTHHIGRVLRVVEQLLTFEVDLLLHLTHQGVALLVEVIVLALELVTLLTSFDLLRIRRASLPD